MLERFFARPLTRSSYGRAASGTSMLTVSKVGPPQRTTLATVLTYQYAILLGVFLLSASGRSIACTAPDPSVGMNRDKLIRFAETIVKVRARSQSQIDRDNDSYVLDTVEVIKGKAELTYRVRSFDSPYSDNDFNGHRMAAFWKKDMGRSSGDDGCGRPLHTFREGATYLLFPGFRGAKTFAEIVRDDNDKWLQYVRRKSGAAANPAFDGGRAKGSRAGQR